MKMDKILNLAAMVAPFLAEREAKREAKREAREEHLASAQLSHASFVQNALAGLGEQADRALAALRDYSSETYTVTRQALGVFERIELRTRDHRDDLTVTITSDEASKLLDEQFIALDKYIAGVRAIIERADAEDVEEADVDDALESALEVRSEVAFFRAHLSPSKVFEMTRSKAMFLAPVDYDSMLADLDKRLAVRPPVTDG